jgi:hypothetical protein
VAAQPFARSFAVSVLAVIAAVAQQYPLRGRLALWLLPATLLAVAAGAEWIRAKANSLHPVLGKIAAEIVGAILVVALLVPPVIALAEAPPPYEIEHHKHFLSYLQKNRRPGDIVRLSLNDGRFGPAPDSSAATG